MEAEKQAQENLGNSPMTFEVVDEATGEKIDVSKKIAYVVNNRPIDTLKVDKFIALISNGKYENAYPTIVADAKTLIAAGYELHDIRGNKVAKKPMIISSYLTDNTGAWHLPNLLQQARTTKYPIPM